MFPGSVLDSILFVPPLRPSGPLIEFKSVDRQIQNRER